MIREEEIFVAFNELNGDKAFSMSFWQESWNLVKGELLEFLESSMRETFTKSLNTTFIILIPKKGGAEDLRDFFKPISLEGSLYKLLAKVLVNRLKRVVGKVVYKAQNTFVEGLQITDAFLIANEIIGNWQKRGRKVLLANLILRKPMTVLREGHAVHRFWL